MFDSPSIPAPTPAPNPPTYANASVRSSALRARQQAFSTTMLTGGQGVTQPASSYNKQLFGQ